MTQLNLQANSFYKEFFEKMAPRDHRYDHVDQIIFPKDGLLKDYDRVVVTREEWVGEVDARIEITITTIYDVVHYDDLYCKLKLSSISTTAAEKLFGEQKVTI